MKAVAIKKGQSLEKATGFQEMGVVRCDGCGEEFVICHQRAFANKRRAEDKRIGSKRFSQMSTNGKKSTLTASTCQPDYFSPETRS